MAIIQAANMLQVVAVERVAVDFLVAGLDAGNVLSAMALGTHLSAGEIGRDLQEQSKAWLNKNFGLMAVEPSFKLLPAEEVATLVASDEIEAKEEEVFAAVMSWVKEDEAGRKAELARLLPLVRFPMMAKPALLISAEPLVVAQHPLAFELLLETHHNFAESAAAAACPRLRPRAGQRAIALRPLAFTRAADGYSISEAGALLSVEENNNTGYGVALCGGHTMAAGRHAAEFTVVTHAGYTAILGLARPDLVVDTWKQCDPDTDKFRGVIHSKGSRWVSANWDGMEGFRQGDVVGLLLDCDAGTLTVKKNGRRLGVAATGLTGEFCWAAVLYTKASVRIAAAAAW